MVRSRHSHRSVPFAAAAAMFAALVALARPATTGELPGRALLDEFLREEVRTLSERCLAGIDGREAWLSAREKLRGELRDMLGLSPEPPRGDLHAVVTATALREDLGIAIEKVHFQSVPGLYVTANFYRPIEARGRLPTILYLCGHGQVKIEGISYGNKASYQHHPAWFARNGYTCLIVDTLQLGEIEGKHHGTYRLGMWWWVSRGYTPAGVEAWNSIRALDYLETRPEVDAKKIGVTGRSGGGIGTWWLAALDDRPAALVPVAGITDLENHVVTGCIDGHCDCNYALGYYRWDYPALAALSAPRPLLLSNTDKDSIFPLDGVLRVHAKCGRIYELLGAKDRLGLCIVEGPHADTQELQVPALRWMDRWLREKPNNPVALLAEKLLDPKDLRVFEKIPADERNTSIERSFVPAAPTPPVPASREAFEALRKDLLAALASRTFRTAAAAADRPLEGEAVSSIERGGLRLDRRRFRSEGPFQLDIWALRRAGAARPGTVRLRVVDEEGWESWAAAAATFFGTAAVPVLPGASGGASASAARTRPPGSLEPPADGEALAVLAPRGIGSTRWADSPKLENQIRRRFLAIGRTLEEARVLDVRRAVRFLGAIEELAGARIEVEAGGEMAGIALYAAVFEPGIARLDLEALPASHHDGVALLGVLRVLDIPQALALVFPREVRLRGAAPEAFSWSLAAAGLFRGASGRPPLEIAVATGLPSQGGSPAGVVSLRQGQQKFIPASKGRRRNVATNTELGNDPEGQLYDLSVDLGETENIISKDPAKAEALEARLNEIRAEGRSRP